MSGSEKKKRVEGELPKPPLTKKEILERVKIHAKIKHNVARAGWRGFRCSECGTVWEWPTRDVRSRSGENCPECGEWEFPCGRRDDNTLPKDESGNLTIPYNITPEEWERIK